MNNKVNVAQLEAERDRWRNRFWRLMGWVRWLRDDVCGFDKRASLRLASGWRGLNRSVGQEDLFMASLEIEAEANGNMADATYLADTKDGQFRALALQAAESSTTSGKPQGKDAPDA